MRFSQSCAARMLVLLALWTASVAAAGQRCATDDLGQRVCLEAPAQRIAALSPGAVELLYAAGAGPRIVAVVAFSDYPPEATSLPSVGSSTRLDLEALLALNPDLVVAWATGNPSEQVERLAALGLPVFSIEPRDFDGVSSALTGLAMLSGTDATGAQAAKQFDHGIAALAKQYANAEPVRVFYQLWDEPLMTVSNEHLIGKVIQLCGGVNVFGQIQRLVPRVSTEAVLEADPEAIITGGMGEHDDSWFRHWAQYPALMAVRRGNLFMVPPSLIQRPTPRLLAGARQVCDQLDAVRRRR